MSFVVAVPEFVADAANHLAVIGSAMDAAHAAAAAQTTALAAAAADEVSAAIAETFSAHASQYQALSSNALPGRPLIGNGATAGSQQVSVVSSYAGGDFNTGITPLLEDPIYLSYSPTGSGTTSFDI